MDSKRVVLILVPMFFILFRFTIHIFSDFFLSLFDVGVTLLLLMSLLLLLFMFINLVVCALQKKYPFSNELTGILSFANPIDGFVNVKSFCVCVSFVQMTIATTGSFVLAPVFFSFAFYIH